MNAIRKMERCLGFFVVAVIILSFQWQETWSRGGDVQSEDFQHRDAKSILIDDVESEQLANLFKKAVESSNSAKWEAYVEIASDDMKRVWLMAAATISFAPSEELNEYSRLFSHDTELLDALNAHGNKYIEIDEGELEEEELNAAYAAAYPNDEFSTHYGVGYARMFAHMLKFELVDRQLIYILRHYGSRPRLYLESEPVRIELIEDRAIVYGKAKMPKKFFGSIEPKVDTAIVEPIPVYFRKIEGNWKLSPFRPPTIDK